MNQDFYNSNPSGFDQFQPPQFPVNYPPQETNKEILQAREDLMETIQAFLKEYDHIPPNKKCMALLLAEERFLKIKQTMEEEQNQPEVMQELLLKLMDDLQILKGSQQEKKETAAQSFTPYWNFSMIDDEEARENFMKDICTFLRKFSRIPFGVTPKSSVENLIPTPNESEDLSNIKSECDVPVCDDFTYVSNPLFDADNDFSSSDDKSFSDEDVPKEIYSNPLFDEEINSTKIDPHHFNARKFYANLTFTLHPPIPVEDKLLYNDSPSLHENESFHFDVPSSPRPPAKPPDDGIYFEPDTGVFTKVVDDISDNSDKRTL
ncbi:hypothetical protein Tco_0702792 [Tanacetum coccineum]|uniref:Uncharacterized protein n=1 Tax=Tanacetum coccineum TaxID=301880 RepID=A0ABQ4XXW1_9ASTR